MKLAIRSNSIKKKIILLTLGLLALMLLSSISTLYNIRQIGLELVSIAEYDIPLTKSLAEVTTHQLEQAIHFERAVRHGEVAALSGHPDNLQQFVAEVAKFNNLTDLIDRELTAASEQSGQAAAETVFAIEQQKFSEIAAALSSLAQSHIEYDLHAQEAFALLKKLKISEAEALIKKITVEEDEIDHKLEAMLLDIEAFTEKAGKNAEKHEQRAELIILTILAFSVIVGPALGWMVFKSIKLRLSLAGSRLDRIASGDLSEEFDDQDEISVPMREMQYQLREMVDTLKASISTMASTSSQVVTASKTNTETADEQQHQIQVIASAMTEINASIEEVSRNIGNSAEESKLASTETQTGFKIVEETTQIVKHLFEQIDGASSVVQQVEHDSANINTVLEVIVSIAEQTNLLALNAAIEAARAGEQGRGFAVVADEVRSLAGRTQESTEEIRGIIEQLQKRTGEAATVMEKSQDQSRKAVDQAINAGKSLESIAAAIDRISQGSGEIAHAAGEQLTAVNEITQSVHSISDLASRNSENAKETLDAANHMTSMSLDLKDLSSRFK